MRVLRLGHRLRRRLEDAPRRAGHVHSVFASVVNVAWHDGVLLALQAPGALAAPFAAACAPWPAAGLVPGLAVERAGAGLRVGPHVLTWTAGEIADLEIPPRAGAGMGPAELRRALPDLAAAPSLCGPRGRAARGALAAAIRARDAAALERALFGLIGLGEGLTPAGDDCAVGALAVLRRFAAEWAWTPAPALADRLAALTTAVGHGFVAHALAGDFSEPLVWTMIAPTAADAFEAARALAARGATSGADTIAGLATALEALS